MSADVLAPDINLRPPRRALPRGTVDCHAHIFDRFERYPLAGERKYSPPLCRREAWLALHAALGVDRGVQVHGSPYGFDNSITHLLESWLPHDAVREPLFAANAATLYRFEDR